MSSVTARSRPRARRAPRRATVRRRRLGALVVLLAAAALVGAIALGLGPLGDAVRQITLPLRHEDIIRQQAHDKGLDPSLVAAVIYEESKFRDQTSHAGARGLMQITPSTAHFIARKSGGRRFVASDLATPQINIAYGSWYLRYLLDRYDGDERLAIAAYNAGFVSVDRWLARAGGRDEFDPDRDIAYAETRAYVADVLERREQYRKHYADELGL